MSTAARLRQIAASLPSDASAVTLTRADLLALLDTDDDTDSTPIADTVAAVATEMGRSPSTVRTWCADGRIPGAYRLRGREWRIPRAALRAYLDAEAGRGDDVPDAEDADLGSWRRRAG